MDIEGRDTGIWADDLFYCQQQRLARRIHLLSILDIIDEKNNLCDSMRNALFDRVYYLLIGDAGKQKRILYK